MKRNHDHWHHMRGPGFGRRAGHIALWGIGGLALACLFALVLGVVVQFLWNRLMPDIFGLGQISYWQAFGLLFLGRLLFGGFHHGPRHGRHPYGGHWKKYDRYWRQEGDSAADELIDRAGRERSQETGKRSEEDRS